MLHCARLPSPTTATGPPSVGSILCSQRQRRFEDLLEWLGWNFCIEPGLRGRNHAPEGADKSRVMAYCNDGGSMSDGAAAGMVSGMQRKALIEHIDATLLKCPFDVKLAQGPTASGWPSDARQPDGSLGTATGEALKMERDMHKMMRQAESEMAAAGRPEQCPVPARQADDQRRTRQPLRTEKFAVMG